MARNPCPVPTCPTPPGNVPFSPFLSRTVQSRSFLALPIESCPVPLRHIPALSARFFPSYLVRYVPPVPSCFVPTPSSPVPFRTATIHHVLPSPSHETVRPILSYLILFFPASPRFIPCCPVPLRPIAFFSPHLVWCLSIESHPLSCRVPRPAPFHLAPSHPVSCRLVRTCLVLYLSESPLTHPVLFSS